MAEVREFGGLDNQNAPSDYGLKRLSIADNIDITRAGKIKTRAGRKRLFAASIDAACAVNNSILYQSGDALHHVISQGEDRILRTGLSPASYLCAEEVNGQICWSNGIDTGMIRAGASESLGIYSPECPGYFPENGRMPTGRYLYAVTVTMLDGYESGAQAAQVAEITTGGLTLDALRNIPEDVVSINLYLSTANGVVLYLAGSSAPGEVISYTGDTSEFGVTLENQFCDRPPAFQDACLYKGRMYYLHGNVLWASRPYNFGLVDYSRDYVPLPEGGVLVAPADDGLYVATASKTYFLSGNDPLDFSIRDVLDHGAIFGTKVKLPALDGRRPQGYVWASDRGAIAAFSSGQIANLTDGVFAYGNAGGGCSVLREQDGQSHFVTALRDSGVPYNARRITILSSINQPLPEVAGIG
jgi:hypothetical protein